MIRERTVRGSIFGAVLALAVLASLLLAWGTSQAQSPQQSYDLSWWTVDGGGDTSSTGGSYSLGGTIGQPDAGLHTDGHYTLGGGFWEGGAMTGVLYDIYLPLVFKNVE